MYVCVCVLDRLMRAHESVKREGGKKRYHIGQASGVVTSTSQVSHCARGWSTPPKRGR